MDAVDIDAGPKEPREPETDEAEMDEAGAITEFDTNNLKGMEIKSDSMLFVNDRTFYKHKPKKN